MSRPRVTVEIDGFGPITFTPLGRQAVERCREAARRGMPRLTTPAVAELDLDPDALLRWREDANLTGAANVEPNFTADELMEEFVDRVEVLNRIRRRSGTPAGRTIRRADDVLGC